MSDSPLPVPSGYICHTSCAVGKGRQPQQHDCPSSHPPYTATPNFTPESQYLLITLEGIVLYSPLSLSFSSLFPPPPLSPARPLHVLLRPTFFSLVFFPPLPRSTLFFKKKRNTHRMVFRSRRAVKSTLAAVLRDTSCTLV